jgi:hypothetical protein
VSRLLRVRVRHLVPTESHVAIWRPVGVDAVIALLLGVQLGRRSRTSGHCVFIWD